MGYVVCCDGVNRPCRDEGEGLLHLVTMFSCTLLPVCSIMRMDSPTRPCVTTTRQRANPVNMVGAACCDPQCAGNIPSIGRPRTIRFASQIPSQISSVPSQCSLLLTQINTNPWNHGTGSNLPPLAPCYCIYHLLLRTRIVYP